MSFTFCCNGHFSNHAPRLGSCGADVFICDYLLQAWDEFKPYKKENKRTKARDATRASVSMDDADSQTADDGLTLAPLALSFLCLSSDRTAIVTDNFIACPVSVFASALF
jgi:hypothetical protein